MADWVYTDLQDLTNAEARDSETFILGDSLPSGIHTIEVMVIRAQNDAINCGAKIQLADGGGYETSGYINKCTTTSASAATTNGFTFFKSIDMDSTLQETAVMSIYRFDADEHHWMMFASGYRESTDAPRRCGGSITLDSELVGVRLRAYNDAAFWTMGMARMRYA